MDHKVEMNTEQYEDTMKGLITTACEKVIVMGRWDAYKDIDKIESTIADMECFWNSDGSLSEKDWIHELREAVESL